MRKLSLILILPLLIFWSFSCDTTNTNTLYKLTTNISPAKSGTITPASGEYEQNSVLEMKAEPKDGYLFVRWEGDHSGTVNPGFVTFNGDKNITAVFVKKEYTLEINVEGEGSVREEIVEDAAKTDYEHGTTVRLTAEPAEGWEFIEWQGDLSGSNNPETIVVDDEQQVTAVFAVSEYSLNITIEGEGTVTSEPDKSSYQFGEEIVLSTEPAEGWRFLEWGGDLSGTDRTVTIESIDTDYDIHAVFSPVQGALHAMGYNHNGQLGDGSRTNQLTPVVNYYDVDQIAAGAYHTLYVNSDGSLWAMGYNSNGQLGNGNVADQHEPVQIDSDVVHVTAGETHSLYIKSDGSLWAMGMNSDGQLGDGTTEDRLNPVQIDTDVSDVSAGGWHTLYVKNDGTLWTMGRNTYGQLGNGTFDSSATPVQVDTDVESVAGGKYHSLFLKTDGTLYGIGRNAGGQLGRSNPDEENPNYTEPIEVDSNVQTMTGGTAFSLYIKTDGSLWATGSNVEGQLGTGSDTRYYYSPIQLASGAIGIAAGNQHSLYIATDGTLYASGRNAEGQLGDGTGEASTTHVQVDVNVEKVAAGISHSLYIKQ